MAAHNNREWFQEHKAEYLAAKSDFEEGIRKAIDHYAGFDDEIAHLQVKDCTYRFYRDIRFSSDKSPYKCLLFANEYPYLVPQRDYG